MTSPETDFRFTNHGSVWTVEAVSEPAKTFAEEAFATVESWQGTPDRFTADWRVVQDIIFRLHGEETFIVELV